MNLIRAGVIWKSNCTCLSTKAAQGEGCPGPRGPQPAGPGGALGHRHVPQTGSRAGATHRTSGAQGRAALHHLHLQLEGCRGTRLAVPPHSSALCWAAATSPLRQSEPQHSCSSLLGDFPAETKLRLQLIQMFLLGFLIWTQIPLHTSLALSHYTDILPAARLKVLDGLCRSACVSCHMAPALPLVERFLQTTHSRSLHVSPGTRGSGGSSVFRIPNVHYFASSL